MCGIMGWFQTGAQALPPEPTVFKRALLALRHRGPDDLGIYDRAGVILGHVRLIVIDPHGGRQPWVDQETGVAVTYNGELYNYIEERTILEKKGHSFASKSDTEVLVRMYLEYGYDMLRRMNGMFAFALYDPRRQTLFCARDHIGIKPFYYCRRHDSFRFSSEVKGLVALGGNFDPEPQGIADYIHLQYVMGEKTFFKDVYRLMPGEYLVVSSGGELKKQVYWKIDPAVTFKGTFADAADRLHELIAKSIRIQLRSDVPLGAHLSGGIDTATVCSLAASHIAPKRLDTFTAGFKEGGIYDDNGFASQTSEFIGTQHHVVYPTAKDFADCYPKLAWYLDEPMAAQGVFPQYIVSRLAKEFVTVVLGGQGADEIIGGYTRYYLLLLDQLIRNGAGRGNENLGISWNEMGISLGQLHHYGPLWARLQQGDSFEDPVRRYWRMIDRSADMTGALTDDFLESLGGYSPFETYREYVNRYPDTELLNRILYFEASCWLPALLHVEDRMSMAVSLESRVPILDPEVISFVFSLPTAIKMKNGQTKALMRSAFKRELLPAIRERRDKLGFPVPTNQWFAGPLKDFLISHIGTPDNNHGLFRPSVLRSLIEHPHGDFDRSLWGILNIGLWFRNLRCEK